MSHHKTIGGMNQIYRYSRKATSHKKSSGKEKQNELNCITKENILITLNSDMEAIRYQEQLLLKELVIERGGGESVKIHCLRNYGTMGGVVEIINYTSGVKKVHKKKQL